MGSGAFDNLLSLELVYDEEFLTSLVEMVTPESVKTLVEDIDAVMFGRKGSLAESVKAGEREGQNWRELTPKYLAWKRRMKASGRDIPGEKLVPRRVISEKLWVRTGKFFLFTLTSGEGRFKKIKITPDEILRGGIFYEAFVEALDYWVYPEKQRPIANFTQADNDKISQLFADWIAHLISLKIFKHGVSDDQANNLLGVPQWEGAQ